MRERERESLYCSALNETQRKKSQDGGTRNFEGEPSEINWCPFFLLHCGLHFSFRRSDEEGDSVEYYAHKTRDSNVPLPVVRLRCLTGQDLDQLEAESAARFTSFSGVTESRLFTFYYESCGHTSIHFIFHCGTYGSRNMEKYSFVFDIDFFSYKK